MNFCNERLCIERSSTGWLSYEERVRESRLYKHIKFSRNKSRRVRTDKSIALVHISSYHAKPRVISPGLELTLLPSRTNQQPHI